MIYHLYHLFKNDVRTLAFCDFYYNVEEKTTIPPKWRPEVLDVPSRLPRAPSHDYFRKFPAKFKYILEDSIVFIILCITVRKKERSFTFSAILENINS
jgi:hypothetical protein